MPHAQKDGRNARMLSHLDRWHLLHTCCLYIVTTAGNNLRNILELHAIIGNLIRQFNIKFNSAAKQALHSKSGQKLYNISKQFVYISMIYHDFATWCLKTTSQQPSNLTVRSQVEHREYTWCIIMAPGILWTKQLIFTLHEELKKIMTNKRYRIHVPKASCVYTL